MIALVLLVTLPLVTLFSFQAVAAAQAEQARIRAELAGAAALLSQRLESELKTSFETLTGLAQSGLSEALQAAQMQQLLQQTGRSGQRWVGIFQPDGQGALVVDTAAWQRLVAGIALPVGAHASIFDQQNRLIAGTKAGPGLFDSSQPVPLAGWTVRVSTPAAPSHAATRKAVITALLVSVASLLASVTLALLVAGRITRPLRRLAAGRSLAPDEPIAIREVAMLGETLAASARREALARERLALQAQELDWLFADNPVALALARDPACVVVSQNAAMDRLLGPTGSVISGSTRVSHRGRLLPPSRQPLERAAALGETTGSQELAISIKGQASTFVLASAVPLRDPAGRLLGAVMAAVDINARKQVEAQLLATDQQLRDDQRTMELAQKCGQVGFFDYRFGADRMTWTAGQSLLFGIAAPAPCGLRQWLGQVDEADSSRIEREIWTACALRRDTATLDYGVTWPDGSAHWLSSRVLLQYDADGRASRMVGVTLDLSAQRDAAKQLEQQADQAMAAQHRIEAASRAKDEFLALLSHELRNPLGALSAASDVLEIAVPGSDSAIEAREIIARQTRHLASLMNDLFDMGQAITGKTVLARRSVDLAAIARRVRQALLGDVRLAGHDIRLHLEESWVDGDALRLEQMVTQLLVKVTKNAPAGRAIDVSVRPMDDCAVLEISGCGLRAGPLPLIDDLLLWAGAAPDGNADDLNIGMTLVRQLALLHGGTMRVEPGTQGSRFCIRLPAARPPEVPADDPLPASRRRNVLVIEDNQDMLAALRSKLELDGHCVSTAADGIDGLSCLLSQRPEVSIVDIGLPGLTGFELARHARAAGYAGRMIAISGDGHEQDAATALVAGFDAYLVKPVDRRQLRASLDTQ